MAYLAQDLVVILLRDLGYYEYYVLFGISHKQLKFTGNYCCIDYYLKYRQDQ